MMKYIIFALLLSIAVSAKPKWPQLQNYTFDQYIEDFEKKYVKESEEYNKRKEIFEAKLKEINSFNGGNHSYKQGVNKMTDQTEQEFKGQSMGLNKSMRRDRSQMFRNLSKKTVSNDPNVQIPTEVDWRKQGVVSPVKDQGGCGSCWAFASVAVMESHAAIAAGAGQLKTLSTQQLVSCVPNPRHCGGTGGCSGAVPELAFNYVALYGLTSEFKYSYTSYSGKDGQCIYNPKTQTPEVINSGYIQLETNNQDALLQAVATAGPVAVSVDASNWGSYEEGVFDGCSYEKSIDINHSVTLVGYGVDPKFGAYWLVRNSWGTEYGEEGYIRIKRDDKAECGQDKTPGDGFGCAGQDDPIVVCGQCGILSDSAYPTKVSVIG